MADRYTLTEAADLFAAHLRREAMAFDTALLLGQAPLSVREGRHEAWRNEAEWRADGLGRIRGWREAAWLVRHVAAHPNTVGLGDVYEPTPLEPEPCRYECECGRRLPCRHCDGEAGRS